MKLCLALLPVFLLCACTGTPTRKDAAAALAAPTFNPGELKGVWEAVSYAEAAGPVTGSGLPHENVKYCFTGTEAYTGLAPDAANDSADGWSDYTVSGDTLLLRGVIGSSVLKVQSLKAGRLVLLDHGQVITFRRISREVSSDQFQTPILRPRRL